MSDISSASSQKRDRSRAAILAAALDLFTERGYDGVIGNGVVGDKGIVVSHLSVRTAHGDLAPVHQQRFSWTKHGGLSAWLRGLIHTGLAEAHLNPEEDVEAIP